MDETQNTSTPVSPVEHVVYNERLRKEKHVIIFGDPETPDFVVLRLANKDDEMPTDAECILMCIAMFRGLTKDAFSDAESQEMIEVMVEMITSAGLPVEMDFTDDS